MLIVENSKITDMPKENVSAPNLTSQRQIDFVFFFKYFTYMATWVDGKMADGEIE